VMDKNYNKFVEKWIEDSFLWSEKRLNIKINIKNFINFLD
jgi:hypothetical protein